MAATAAAIALPASTCPAQTAERFTLYVEGSGGVATNPFLDERSDNFSSFVAIGVSPSFIVEDERGSVRLDGNVRGTQYLRRFGSSYSLDGRLSVDRRLSEALTITAQAAAESSVVGERDTFVSVVAPPDFTPGEGGGIADDPIGDLLDPLDPDLGLIGGRSRRNVLSAQLGIDYTLFPQDRIQVRLGAAKSSFPGLDAGVGSRNLSGSLSYVRSLSPASSLGISASVEQSRFGRGAGTSTVYQPQISYSGRVYPAWEFSISAGASFIRSERGDGRSTQSVGFAGEVSACRQGSRLRFCLAGSRGAQENGLGAIGERTSVSAQIDYALSERETLGVVGALGRTEQSVNVIGLPDQDVGQSSLQVDYRRRLRDRWDIGVTGGYRDVYRSGRPIEADFYATVSFRVGFER